MPHMRFALLPAWLAALPPAEEMIGGTICLTGEEIPGVAMGRLSPVWSLAGTARRVATVLFDLIRDERVLIAIVVLVVAIVVGEVSGWSARRLVSLFSLRRERGRYVALTTLGGIIFLSIAIFRPGAHLSPVFVGRLLIVFLLVVGLAWLLTARQTGRGFRAAVEDLARAENMSLIMSPGDEAGHPGLYATRRFMDRDTRRWELDGGYPYAYADRGGGIMTVRMPVGFDYDPGSPASTRIGCFKRVRLGGLTVRDRHRYPPDSKKKLVETGDEGFDDLFVVESRHPDEVDAVLTPEIRRSLVEAATVDHGLRIDMFGPKVYLRDRAFDIGLLRMWLGIIERLAGSLDQR